MSYSNRVFRNLSSYPNENTLEVNVTHEQLNSLASEFEKRVALAPTRAEEDKVGFDVTFDTAKEIVFQHKAPSNTVVRRDERGDKRQWINFELDQDQLITLGLQYSPHQAYYALPVIPELQQMRDCLLRTVFVDAFALFLSSLQENRSTSRVYVEYCADIDDHPILKGKFNSAKRAMDREYGVYYDLLLVDHTDGDAQTWSAIRSELMNCRMGLPIRGDDIGPRWEPIQETPPGFERQYSENFHPLYIEFLQRRWAINEYARSDNEGDTELFNWILDSLQTQYQRANRYELSVFDEELFEQEEVRHQIRCALNNRGDTSEPSNYGLSGISRYILEKGSPADSEFGI